MATETEVKILDVNPSLIRDHLNKNKAKLIKKVNQINSYYENKYTKKNKITLRIREEKKNIKITIKTSKNNSSNKKIRNEYEFQFNHKKIIQFLLKILHLKKTQVIKMKREYYNFMNCSVELIKTKGVNNYIEIEGSNKNIDTVAKLLGFTKKQYDKRSIRDILKK